MTKSIRSKVYGDGTEKGSRKGRGIRDLYKSSRCNHVKLGTKQYNKIMQDIDNNKRIAEEKAANPYPVLKAIPTNFEGISFRSRLEARWAVFFTALKLRYEYEVEGYDLDGVWYLPDYYVPRLNCFIEVKGKVPTPHEMVQAFRLSKCSGKFVHIFSGQIPRFGIETWAEQGFRIYTFSYQYEIREPMTIGQYMFFNECPVCHKIDFAVDGELKNLPCRCTRSRSSKLSNNMQIALSRARNARFEFYKDELK